MSTSKEQRMGICGKTFWERNATGEFIEKHYRCGLPECSSCRYRAKDILYKTLVNTINSDPDSCLLILEVRESEKASKIIRTLRRHNMPYKRLPKDNYIMILTVGKAAPYLWRYEYNELITVEITDRFLEKILSDKKPGYRDSGDLFPAFDDMATNFYKIKNKFEKSDSCKEPLVSVNLYSVISETKPEDVVTEKEAFDLDSLQECLLDLHNQTAKNATLGVFLKRKSFYALSDIPAICEIFNQHNQELKARLQVKF